MTKNQMLMFLNGCAVMGVICGILCEIAKYSPWGIWMFMGSVIWLVLFLFVNYDLRYSDWGIKNATDNREKEKKDSGSISEMERSIRHGRPENCRDIQDYVKERALRSEIQKEN